MTIDDPGTWLQVGGAIKSMIDNFRSALGLLRDVRDLSSSPEQQRAISAALDNAEAAAKVAEAQMAKALGYELCRCEFPPNIMKTVGFIMNGHAGMQGPVYECAKCGYITSLHWSYTRTAPERV